MADKDFSHLHLHTTWSLLDGANVIKDLVPHIKEMGMTSCAITDHGWMAGVVEFYKECRAQGIKPLIGVEAYITEDEDDKDKDKVRDNMHMVLIAKDNRGYELLLEACSVAALRNFYHKPRISKKNLERMGGHVVATSACLGGVVAKNLHFEEDPYGRVIHVEQAENKSSIVKDLEYFGGIFGDDFFIELQDWDNGDHAQPMFNKFLLQEGRRIGLPFVLTADCHYMTREDTALHEMLMAIQFKQTVEQYRESGDMQYGPYFYVKTPEEMLEAAKKWECEEAYYNTGLIAERCNVEIELGKYKPPVFDLENTEDYQEFLSWKSKQKLDLECSHRH